MKTLHIIDALESGGKERQALELLKGLKSKPNLSIVLVVLSESNQFPYSEKLGIPIYYLQRKYKNDLSIFMRLYKIIKDFRPEIVHSWNLMCSIYILPICKMLNIKFINGVIRDCPLKTKKFRKIWFQIKLTFPLSDIILANSAAGLKAYLVSSKKGYYIHNGFDKTRISEKTDQAIIRKHYNIHTKNVVGMVARFSHMKDYHTYLSAALYLLGLRNDVTFLAIGDGPHLEKFKLHYQTAENDRIKFLGNQTNVEPLIKIFNIGVLSTFTEGISNSIMEYMAFAKPVVATDGGGTSELVCDKKTGFLVKQQDKVALVDRIEYLLNHPDQAHKMGQAGKQRLEREFNLEKMTNNHMELYQQCLKG